MTTAPKKITDWEKWLLRVTTSVCVFAGVAFYNKINNNLNLIQSMYTEQQLEKKDIEELNKNLDAVKDRVAKLEKYQESEDETRKAKEELKHIRDDRSYTYLQEDTVTDATIPIGIIVDLCEKDAWVNQKYIDSLNYFELTEEES